MKQAVRKQDIFFFRLLNYSEVILLDLCITNTQRLNKHLVLNFISVSIKFFMGSPLVLIQTGLSLAILQQFLFIIHLGCKEALHSVNH